MGSENKASEIFVVDANIDKKTAIQDEIFAWDRTVSRLTEMQALDYLKDHSRKLSVDEFWTQFDLKKFIDEEIDEVWHRFDVDDSGELDQEELRGMIDEVYRYQGYANKEDWLSAGDFDMVWSAFDNDGSGLVDKEEFRSYVKKYTLDRIPPFVTSVAGAKPELTVSREGAKLQRVKSVREDIERKRNLGLDVTEEQQKLKKMERRRSFRPKTD